MNPAWVTFRRAWDEFFFAPMPLRVCATLRIAFGALMLVNCIVIFAGVDRWFGPEGVLTFEASRRIIDPDTLTIFQWFPHSTLTPRVLAAVMLVNCMGLVLGIYGRLNAACLFVLYTSFVHRNLAYCDSEDRLLRLACFFLALMPVDAACGLRAKRFARPPVVSVWPLRLFQIEMTLIYLSTALLKMRGPEWWDGTALHSALGVELYQRFPIPESLANGPVLSRLATWGVLAVESLLPLALWLPRFRVWAVGTAIAMHLAIDYSMNLFLFEWAMIAGLLAFLPAPRAATPGQN
jgi:hypothetical protein